MQKQKVLIVHNYYQIPGGEDTVVANEKRLLEKNGHKVFLYIRDNKELKELTKFQKLWIPFTTIFNIRTYCEVKKIIKEQQIDIVHVHNTLSLISPSVYYAALRCKVPVVQTIHNFRLLCPGAVFYRDGHICEDCIRYGLRCSIKHKCYRNSKMQTLACVINIKLYRFMGIYGKLNYICLTEFNKRKLLKLKQIRPEQVFVKPNFVSVPGKFTTADKEKGKIKLKDNFIYVGRLDKLKGIDLLLQAWKLLGEKSPKLIICGTGPMESYCREFILENELLSVELKGFIPNEEVRELTACSQALILPTQCYEGFPMSIVEAFSVGTPVICSDLGNAGCLVSEGVNGYKFKAGSAEGLAQAVKKIGSRKGMRQMVRDIYEKKYTESKNYRILETIYSQLA